MDVSRPFSSRRLQRKTLTFREQYCRTAVSVQYKILQRELDRHFSSQHSTPLLLRAEVCAHLSSLEERCAVLIRASIVEPSLLPTPPECGVREP
eukprot:6198961-Pyramimonas_sp.AAC.2